MKSVLISIQPYWVFLIIAKTMGWNISKEKTVEVRKNFPKDENWNKIAKTYCSKDKKSLAKIPKEYQPLMKRFLGKVIGEFVCDRVYNIPFVIPFDSDDVWHPMFFGFNSMACLADYEIDNYLGKTDGYGWHISDLVIYDKPKWLSEFSNGSSRLEFSNTEDGFPLKWSGMKRPPQSWCYVEEVRNNALH